MQSAVFGVVASGLIDECTGDGGSHKGSDGACDHRFDAEFGDVASPVRRDTADTADLDGDGTEVCEAAEGIAANNNRSVMQILKNLRQVAISDEFVENHLLAEELSGHEAIAEGDAHEEGNGEEDNAEDHFEGEERPERIVFDFWRPVLGLCFGEDGTACGKIVCRSAICDHS